ncbi:MAG: hypothetical protein ABS84_13025 [Rubrivivax sp. SCN 71-131]|nr:MAG: hypothetical protein ABS84_13025 [Rubrivivax sp. SCN 71-131]
MKRQATLRERELDAACKARALVPARLHGLSAAALHARQQGAALRGIKLHGELRPAPLQAAVGPGILHRPLQLDLVTIERDLHQARGQRTDEEVEVVAQAGLRQRVGDGRSAPAPAGQAQALRQRGLQRLHGIAQVGLHGRQGAHRHTHGLKMRHGGGKAAQARQARPGVRVQAGHGGLVGALHAFDLLQDLGRGEAGSGRGGDAAGDHQVVGRGGSLRVEAHRHRCGCAAAAQRLPDDRAVWGEERGGAGWRKPGGAVAALGPRGFADGADAGRGAGFEIEGGLVHRVLLGLPVRRDACMLTCYWLMA